MKSEVKNELSYHRECIPRILATATPERGRVAFDNRGFTLIELFLVCLILGILVLLAIPMYKNTVYLAKVARCREEIRTLEKEINAYQADRGMLPSSLSDFPMGNIHDPWGNPYHYRLTTSTTGTPFTDLSGNPLNSDYDLSSTGEDGSSSWHLSSAPADKISQDDIIRAGEGTFVELGSKLY